nr:hypothetical protein [Phaeovulum veldkampii]
MQGEPQNARLKPDGALKIGDFQVNMPDAGREMDRGHGGLRLRFRKR